MTELGKLRTDRGGQVFRGTRRSAWSQAIGAVGKREDGWHAYIYLTGGYQQPHYRKLGVFALKRDAIAEVGIEWAGENL